MKIKVKIHPNSSREKVHKIDDENYEIWIKEKPIENKANKALMKILKQYFKRQPKIKSGATSRMKIVELD